MTDVADRLASRVETYLVTRYPGEDLDVLTHRLYGDEQSLACALVAYREASGVPSPGVMGEPRCVTCRKLMDDERSVDEDEELCEACFFAAMESGDE